MSVRVDQPGHHGAPVGVDHLRVGCQVDDAVALVGRPGKDDQPRESGDRPALDAGDLVLCRANTGTRPGAGRQQVGIMNQKVGRH
jgi:hypothetical protein